ncbi:hypothetical protein AAHB54_02725, partial [Bacillus cereus]
RYFVQLSEFGCFATFGTQNQVTCFTRLLVETLSRFSCAASSTKSLKSSPQSQMAVTTFSS